MSPEESTVSAATPERYEPPVKGDAETQTGYALRILRDEAQWELRRDLADYFERLASNRNPDDPEGSVAYSRWAMNAADRIRHPERYEGVTANVEA